MGETQAALDRLIQYCEARNISLHPSIEPKQIQGRGIGVYCRDLLGPGQRLVHVPAKELFTTANIPESFFDKSARSHLAVHAQLAAFLAFGWEALIEYEHWLSTWPGLEDFTDTMPMFWGESINEELQKVVNKPSSGNEVDESRKHLTKRRKTETRSTTNDNHILELRRSQGEQQASIDTQLLLSPALNDATEPLEDATNSTRLVPQMVSKVVKHIVSVSKALPYLNLTSDHENLTKFLHAWCQVNTRCFYYISPIVPSRATSGKKKQNPKPRAKPKPPSDPNEAMALCPFMDLFNHTAPPMRSISLSNPSEAGMLPCDVKTSSAGFNMSTMSSIDPNTELLLSYGPHTNDTLWSEYGFLLPGSSNTSDSTSLDRIVLLDPSLTEEDKEALEGQGYLSGYVLNVDGSVCYRTEMVAWLLVLGRRQWAKIVEQGLDPEDADAEPVRKHQKSAGGLSLGHKHGAVIQRWLSQLLCLSRDSISTLTNLSSTGLLTHFSTLSIVASNRPSQPKSAKLALAGQRRDMCVMRWEQVKAMSEAGLALITERDV